MRIGAVAAASDVSVETLRFYERRGLLAPPARLASGYRDYPDEAVRVVRFVKHAQDLGFTLDDIAGLLARTGGGPDGCDTVRNLAKAKIDTVTDKVAHLVAIRDALHQLVATCEQPRPAGTARCWRTSTVSQHSDNQQSTRLVPLAPPSPSPHQDQPLPPPRPPARLSVLLPVVRRWLPADLLNRRRRV